MKNSPYLDRPLRSESEARGETGNQAHTPGPWATLHGFPHVIVMNADRKLANGGSIHAYDYGTRFARQIARVSRVHNMPGDLDANARLIASAPKLFSQLQQFVSIVEIAQHEEWRNAAGELACREPWISLAEEARIAIAKAKGD